jgi:hypothetical protein
LAVSVCLVAGALLPAALTAAAFLSGLLLGWSGVAGAAAGALLGHLISAQLPAGAVPVPGPAVLLPTLTGALAAALGAAAAATVPWLVFRGTPGIGRGLPNLLSYLWLLAAGAMASVASAVIAGSTGWMAADPAGSSSLLAAWTDAFEGLTAIAIAAPLGVIAADLWGRRLMTPLRGEMPARRTLDLTRVARFHPKSAGSATRILTAPEPEIGRRAALGLAAVLAVTAVVVPVVAVLPTGGHWTLLLYLAPIFWAATGFGLRGAVATASASALAFVAAQTAWDALTAERLLAGSALSWRSAHAELVLFGLIGAFAGLAAEREHALRNEVVHRNQLLRQDLLRVVQALVSAVEAKDVYTEGHLRRVSDYAVRVAETMGLHGQALEMVFFASMLHDIGKIGVPEEILTKEGPLTPAETLVMQQHAEAGARMLRNLDVLRDAAPLVLHHQERWDGRRDGDYPGYPAGLAGDAIPLGSRIIAVVDAFDAMTTDRPYRNALSVSAAIAELREQAGSQFDPRVVEVFVAQLEEHPWKVEVA